MPRRGRRAHFLLVAAAIVALVAGWGAGRFLGGEPGDASREHGPPRPAALEATAAGGPGEPAVVLHRPRPDFTLPDLEGRMRRPDEWAEQVLVVNFWATWCAPCREEIPLLIELERRRPGVRIIGIAVDTADAVRAFAAEMGIGYPVLLDDLRGSTMRRYGNRFGALPFTVVAGRDGVVAYVRLGALEAGELDTVVEALL